MKSQKFLFSNLFIGAILGVILSGPFFVVWNLLADSFSFPSLDIITIFTIIIPLSMIGMAIVLRNRQPINENQKITTYDKKSKTRQ